MSMFEALGERAKLYERRETSLTFMPLLPVYARLDGRGFSKFTRGMRRPYDTTMAECMLRTAEYLVEATHARIAYTQSDEISLVWCSTTFENNVFFMGRQQKMTSVLAGAATAAFVRQLLRGEYASRVEQLPHFDCRVFQLPSEETVADVFLWREMDATKNAVTMAARAYFSHAQIQGKHGGQMQEMLFQRGVNFNDYPAGFKRGTYLRRVVQEREMTSEELAAIPAAHRPAPGTLLTRSAVRRLQVPPLRSLANRAGFIMRGEEPQQWEAPPGD